MGLGHLVQPLSQVQVLRQPLVQIEQILARKRLPLFDRRPQSFDQLYGLGTIDQRCLHQGAVVIDLLIQCLGPLRLGLLTMHLGRMFPAAKSGLQLVEAARELGDHRAHRGLGHRLQESTAAEHRERQQDYGEAKVVQQDSHVLLVCN